MFANNYILKLIIFLYPFSSKLKKKPNNKQTELPNFKSNCLTEEAN